MMDTLCDRRQLEDAYTRIHNAPKPRLEQQGSDALLSHSRWLGQGGRRRDPAKQDNETTA